MYLQSFGLREKPFTLSPDPRYLFLAESHREALAHLLYGVDQGEGFIAVVGEVGTGKTTLCRTLLQRLGAETEVAFVFNPDLSPQELLESVCNEFGIAVPGGASRRDLLDRINGYLVHNKGQGRRVLLIIDEAQNLPSETLEQVRLLSNLETETSKLIQIVLLGQPELSAKLASNELRQLRQRISVWWNLGPLSRAETFEYVRHRLRVAGGAARSPFSDGALREVHRRSAGVPRVVNILCDRALLSAFAEEAREVRARHVRSAAAELGPARSGGAARRALLHPGWFAAAGAAALMLGAWQLLAGTDSLSSLLPVSRPATPAVAAPPPEPALAAPPDDEPIESVEPAPAADVSAPPPPDLDVLLEGIDASQSEQAAAGAMLASWTLDPVDSVASLSELTQGLRARGLRVQRIEGADLAELEALNHPAVLRVLAPGGEGRSVVLRHLDGGVATLVGIGGTAVTRIPAAELEARFTGEAYVPWRDFVRTPPILRDGHAGSSVFWLQQTLAELGYYAVRPTGRFDPSTRSAVQAFQASHGLEPDGEVGPRTKMVLYDAAGSYPMPRLREAG